MITPEDIFDYAVTKNKAHAQEVEIRRGISESYYAVYHAALIFAQAKGFRLNEDEPTHSQLRQLFLHSSDRQWKAIGVKLKNAHLMRVDADYDLNQTIGLNKLQAQLHHCRQCLQDLNRLFQAA